MAAQTNAANYPIASVWGDDRVLKCQFASVATGDTYAAPMNTIQSVSCDPGSATVMGATFSGTTVTFTVTSGPATNVNVLIIGR